MSGFGVYYYHFTKQQGLCPRDSVQTEFGSPIPYQNLVWT